jgi:hypothetical protein
MGRNVQGGNKTKSMARNSGRQDREIRVPQTEEEEYGIVTAVSGNGRFRITSENKKPYIGVLPGSMRGNKKRRNYVELNSIVLIDNRSSWQTVKELSPADIVHVYSSNHVQELKLHEKFQEQLTEHFNKGSQLDKNLVVFDNNASILNDSAIQQLEENEEEIENQEEFDIDLI